ncbi:helix-turn-helix domain-containing protein [Alphaproteobacteria bacterium KMM 3653]|uniref:Helix-turn-helix domain-containing protein n=1 Tax=Harenicola maris TaxID=2841044 RepID=A0AAP2G7A3_9RHOB|nr:helix-turn-helix domain-containing protein [Harenicola maris]
MSLDAPQSHALGPDLRALRRARAMTLEDVAEALNKSTGWLSQVERGISTPTLPDLRALAAHYGVALSLLTAADGPAREQGRITRAGQRRAMGSAKSGLTEELLSPDLTDDFEMIHSVFAPGAKLTEPKSRPTQEVAYLISGALTVWIDGERFDIAPGDTFRIRGEAYAWENPGPEPAVVIWVIAPPVY